MNLMWRNYKGVLGSYALFSDQLFQIIFDPESNNTYELYKTDSSGVEHYLGRFSSEGLAKQFADGLVSSLLPT